MLQNQAANIDYFQVTILLNKNQKYSGKISFSKKQPELFTINICTESLNLNLQYPRHQLWINYEQFLTLKPQNKNSIFLNLSTNKMKFLKTLNKIKIYCHYGNFLTVIFSSEDLKNLFLFKFLDNIYLKVKDSAKQLLSIKKSQNLMTPSIRQSDIYNIFGSQQFISSPNTPQVQQNVLQDFRNIVFTPKPQLDKDIRDRFVNFQNFIKNESNKSLPKLQQIFTPTQAIKQQSIEQQSQSKKKGSPSPSTPKSHQFIFVRNRNRQQSKIQMKTNYDQHQQKLKIPQTFSQKLINMNTNIVKQSNLSNPRTSVCKQRKFSKQINRQFIKQKQQKMVNTNSTKSISYEQLIQRNKFLEQLNRKLVEQNLKLKERLSMFVTFKANKSKQKNQNTNIPDFIKSKQSQRLTQQQQNAKEKQFFNTNPNININYNYKPPGINPNSDSALNRYSNSHLYGNSYRNNAQNKNQGVFGRVSQQLNDGRYWQIRVKNPRLTDSRRQDTNSKSKSKSRSKSKYRLSDAILLRKSKSKTKKSTIYNPQNTDPFFKNSS